MLNISKPSRRTRDHSINALPKFILSGRINSVRGHFTSDLKQLVQFVLFSGHVNTKFKDFCLFGSDTQSLTEILII